mgnify:CR=1 FL=1
MKLALAQIGSKSADVAFNIQTHINSILKASKEGVDYLVFPELSLTGYELERGLELAFSPHDKRLEKLIEVSVQNNITVCVGAPLYIDETVHLGSIIIKASGEIETYSKIHLHGDEKKYFTAGINHHCLKIKDTTIANAICADTSHSIHAKTCASLGADVYVAGVMYFPACYDKDIKMLSSYAKEFDMLVGTANHNKPTGPYTGIGKSALWDKNGLIVSANETDDVLVIAEKIDTKWIGSIVEL